MRFERAKNVLSCLERVLRGVKVIIALVAVAESPLRGESRVSALEQRFVKREAVARQNEASIKEIFGS